MQQDPLKSFGLRLVQLRKSKGLSQEKLALESGIARSYLSGVERGQRNIALLNIHKLADTLGIPASSLLELPDD
ncbi:helix-turn-helix domain-containing protein [Alysiella filiformis]|uniref:Helix-turn-helix n=1 Tax=Alysiella filiformis DSM 16848 TaxID=1120981 RepID=A0A286EFH4_9NEIS|nr:helix-turn-helix transcriptional regulator [Alysiella filiformis]QMT30648.1 helix-turn-helix transcriptional regulator [Alysiella filiformis]UBQ56374.1 helix-turn-helix domain-containing protein [Alysiella filiformis DSM 16848]SOD69675.1 Helix-turn-helix [Alysiella filiformis DSM 16848]